MERFTNSIFSRVMFGATIFLIALTLFAVLIKPANATEVKQCCKKVGFNGDLECRYVEKFAFCKFDEFVVD